MNAVSSLMYPVLAFTPVGVVPYTSYDNLIRVTKREYNMNWFTELEIIDARGTCVVIHMARIAKEPLLTKLLGGHLEVEIMDAEKLTEYDVSATRSRVIEFLSIYPEMFESAGNFDEMLRQVNQATTSQEIIQLFLN